MPAGSGTGGSSGDIVMKHSQHFFKEIISMRRTQKTGKKRIFHCITADRQKIGLTDIVVIFRMKFFHYGKNIMDRLFFNSRYKRGDVLIMIIKSASRDTGCFCDIGYSDLVSIFFLYKFKKAPRIASSATEYLSSETGFCIVTIPSHILSINIIKYNTNPIVNSIRTRKNSNKQFTLLVKK